MESPLTIVKSNLTLSKILSAVVVTFAVFFLFDALGWTQKIIYPFTSIKNAFAKK